MNSNSIDRFQQKKVLIVNLHSAQNLGDLAILEQTTKLLEIKHPESDFVLMSTYPTSWRNRTRYICVPSLSKILKSENLIGFSIINFINLVIRILVIKSLTIGSAYNKKLNQLISTIANSDIVYSAGGGNFYTNSRLGIDFIINCLTVIIAGKLGKPIIMLPQSFGPVQTCWQKKILKKTISYVDLVYARENMSYDFLINIGVSKRKIKILPDLALSIENDVYKKVYKEPLTIGLSIIDRHAQNKMFTRQNDYENAIISFVEQLVKQRNAKFILIVQCDGPTSDQNDIIVSEKILSKLSFEDDRVKLAKGIRDLSEFSKMVNELDVLISTRMHTGIIGLVHRVPTILIGYQPKAEGLFHLLDLDEYHIEIDNVTSEFLLNRFNKILENYATYVKKIEMCIPKISSEIKKEILNLR